MLRRRGLLRIAAAALGTFLGTAISVPLFGAVVGPALRRDEPPWVPMGPDAGFPVGRPRLVTFGVTRSDGYAQTTAARAVWVCRLADDQLVIYNARCTHLGCLVNYRADSETFLSPCHGGVFSLKDGRVMDGPPPRSLDRLAHRVENGQLLVQYRDFLAGVTDQVAL